MNQRIRVAFISLFVCILASCGSGQSDESEIQLSSGISSSTRDADFGKPNSSDDTASLAIELGNYFNGPRPNDTKAMTKAADARTSIDAKALATNNTPRDVYRFYNPTTGAHFYTMSAEERDYVRSNNSFFSYEGKVFSAYAFADQGLSPIYRFYNKVAATHFYTASTSEKDHVIATWPQIFNYEGVAWYASELGGENLGPVYRFFNTRTGAHVYTTSESEKNYISAVWNWIVLEGVAYFVPQDPYANCIPPSCYPPAPRPGAVASKNVMWLRTDSNQFDWLTANRLMYADYFEQQSRMNPYDHSIQFSASGIEFFVRPGTNLPTVYKTEYVQQNVDRSASAFNIGLNSYTSKWGETTPNLQISTPGKGCGSSDGAFYLHELETTPEGRVSKFAIDYKFNCDGNEGVNGVVRYNSDVPSVLSQVFAVAGPDFAVQEGRSFPLLGNRSWSPSSKIKKAAWTQISGPQLDLSGCAQLKCNTFAPLVPAGGATAVLRLTVESESGLIGSDTVNVEIRSSLDRQTRLDVWGQGFVVRGVGGDLHMNDLNARVQVPRGWTIGGTGDQSKERVHVIVRGRTQDGGVTLTGVNMEFMNTAGSDLVPGKYLNANINGGLPHPTIPGVNVSAEGATCGHQLANMYVGDLQRDALDLQNISSLSVLSEISCTDDGLDEPTFSRLWINHQPAEIPVAVITGVTRGAAGQRITLGSSPSLARKGVIVNKMWRIVSPVSNAKFSGADVDTATLDIDQSVTSGSKVIVSLEVFDSSGDSGITLHTITIP